MNDTVQTVQIAAVVPIDLAERLRSLAKKAERSQAAELRLAVKAWVETAELREAA